MRRAVLAIESEVMTQGLLLLGAAGMVGNLLAGGTVLHYVNPSYRPFLAFAAMAMGMLGLVRLAGAVRRLPEGAPLPAARPLVSTASYLAFALTVGAGLVVPPVTLGADLARAQGIVFAQRAQRVPVALTPGSGPVEFLRWLASAPDGMRRGAYAATRPPQTPAAEVAKSGRTGEMAVPSRGTAPPGSGEPSTAGGADAGQSAPDRSAAGAGGGAGPATGAGGPGEPAEPVPAEAPAAPRPEATAGAPVADRPPGDPVPAPDRIVLNDDNFFAVLAGLWHDPAAYSGREAEIVGFVVHFPELGEERFMVARLVVTCHVAHALPDGLIVRHSDGARLPADTWVRVVGVLELEEVEGWPVAVLHADRLERVPPLPSPYVYP